MEEVVPIVAFLVQGLKYLSALKSELLQVQD